MNRCEELSSETANRVFVYDNVSGELRWKVDVGFRIKAGSIAGGDSGRGYIRLMYKNKNYLAHRIIWAMFNGRWPTDEIDHINGNKKDNRINNLRECGRSFNMQNRHGPQSNNSTGFLGVSPYGHKYRATLIKNKQQIYLGIFNTPQEAHDVYLYAKRRDHEGCTI